MGFHRVILSDMVGHGVDCPACKRPTAHPRLFMTFVTVSLILGFVFSFAHGMMQHDEPRRFPAFACAFILVIIVEVLLSRLMPLKRLED